MNWYRHPETVDRLAAQYVMGRFSPPAQRRFEQVMRQRTEVAQAVEAWSDRALPLLMSLPELSPPPDLWAKIEQRTQGRASAASAAAQARAPSPSSSSNAQTAAPWWRRWLAPVPAGAWAFGLVLGISLPLAMNVYQAQQQEMQLPQSYVGVLATAAGKPGLIVSSLRRGTRVDLKELSPVAVPAGQTLYLWRIDKLGAVTPLGAIPTPQAKFAHLTLSEPAETAFFPAVELAVSLETVGSQPAQPSGAFVYRGLCGKLWK
jgi:anti-sigma-K factor RskA